MEDKLYTAKEIAHLLGVNKETVLKWCRQGKLRHFRLGKCGCIRIWHSDIQALVRGGNVRVDSDI